jgi:hypothetical protein
MAPVPHRISEARHSRRPDSSPTLGAVAEDDLIDDARRARLEIDDADNIHLAVLSAADIVDYRELPVGRDHCPSAPRGLAVKVVPIDMRRRTTRDGASCFTLG